MRTIVKVYLIFIVLASFITSISFKIATNNNEDDLRGYFISYIYNKYVSLSLFFIVVVVLSSAYMAISFNQKLPKVLNNGIRVVIVLFLIIMPIGITTQIIIDYKLFDKKQIYEGTINIESYELSNGFRGSNNVLPYKIKAKTGETYYLYRRMKFTEDKYSIKFMKNHSNDKIILSISK